VKRIEDTDRSRLRWTQPRLFDRNYELRCGEDTVATLSFRSAFGSLATAETAAGVWTFKRVGFWQTRATVRAEGQPVDLAVFEHNTWSGGGTLTFADGRSLQVTTNLWQSRIEFRLDEDRVLFRYHTEGFLRHEASLEVLPEGEQFIELPWLLAFGWYLTVMMYQDSATSAAIIG
jgi:hypothetical protein